MTKSIICETKQCYLCGRRDWIERHHIYGGAFRNKSEKYGLVVYLCKWCHNEPPYGVHFNRERMDMLRAIGQRAFIEHYPDKDFMEEFGRNFLDDNEKQIQQEVTPWDSK